MRGLFSGGEGLLSEFYRIDWQVVDQKTQAILGSYEDGEICIRGPTVMKGIMTQFLSAFNSQSESNLPSCILFREN